MSDAILLGHGGGGLLSRELIETEILPRFGAGPLRGLPDAASLTLGGNRVCFTTDSFVVQPLFFPGGSIGDLAVHGTVNDLAVCGARPRWLSLGLILEEGLPMATLRRVLDDIQRAARDCGVVIATGDAKVTPRGACDGLFINTAGLGEPAPGFHLGPERIRPGDRILASGPLGDHGAAVMAARSGLQLENGPVSDSGPVHRLVMALAPDLAAKTRFMRDPTRGGAAALLNEAVAGQAFGAVIREADLPLAPAARALAEMLGLDLLHVASEGCLILFCAPEAGDEILARWRALPEGADAAWIGEATDDAGRVVLETAIGGRRVVDVPQGELLPRIC